MADNQVPSDSQNSLEERKMHSFFNFLKLFFSCLMVGNGEPISTEIVLPASLLVWHFVMESVISTGCSCIVRSVSFLGSVIKISQDIIMIIAVCSEN